MSNFLSVRAGQIIPAYSISLPFTSKIDLKKIFLPTKSTLNQIEVFCTQDGLLYIEKKLSSPEKHWANLIEIANNCSEHNVTLNKIIGTNQYQIKTTRLLELNETFKLWPNINLLNEWKIPYFLQPSCIINKDHYKCNQCSIIYREPNQLKIHIALMCKSIINKTNDNKLNKNLFLTSPSINLNSTLNHPLHPYLFNSNATNSIFTFNLNLNSSLKKNSNHFTITNSNNITNNIININCDNNSNSINVKNNNFNDNDLNENNFLNNSNHNKKRKLSEKHKLVNTLNKLKNENSSSNKPNLKSNLIESDISSSDTLEEIISEKEISSSMNIITNNSLHKHKTLKTTKEPRSHTCVFCGKLYTRKYGLKIHIRTHTGHKPLKCTHCARAFSDPSNLNKHMRLHQQHRKWNKHVNLKT